MKCVPYEHLWTLCTLMKSQEITEAAHSVEIRPTGSESNPYYEPKHIGFIVLLATELWDSKVAVT